MKVVKSFLGLFMAVIYCEMDHLHSFFCDFASNQWQNHKLLHKNDTKYRF